MNRVSIFRNMKLTVPFKFILDMVQKELCIGCPVYKYKNKNCDNCKNNISKGEL